MSNWGSINLINASNSLIEIIIYFHDYIIIFLSIILLFIIYFLVLNLKNNYLDKWILESHFLEFIWTVFPIIILLFIAYPSLIILYYIENSEIRISHTYRKIIAHQWYWEYENIDNQINSYLINSPKLFYTFERTDSLILPINSLIQIYITSRDVLHSFTVPSFGIKLDAIPGRLNILNFNINFPGVYYGQCSEICGANHRFIPIQIISI